ncbi:MAG: glycosyltransferase [Bowdeniella nasicola]|nr:glycosyltransferase [Bowdeniella nasicola]
MERICAVVVAYNRRDLLTRTLDALAAQERPLDQVVVIDNASTDGSGDLARRHPTVSEVLTMEKNLGGAGGFAAGIARAVAHHRADLVWVMDDDTVPSPGALAALLRARDAYPGSPAVLASRVVWHDGRDHPMNTPRTRPLVAPDLAEHARAVGCRQIRSASFVSILIDSRAIWEDGLPEADYFLWNDDFEYTARLLRRRVGLYVPDSVVTHLTRTFGASETDPGARFFNEVRNKVWMYTRSRALGPLETALYGGRTVLRWGQTIAASGQRRALLSHARRGLWAALRAPRSVTRILAATPAAPDARTVSLGTPPPAAHGVPHAFSVLLPVYAGDDAAHVERALRSVSRDQELIPDEIVIVRDGPVGPGLTTVLTRAAELAAPSRIRLVELERNVGLSAALSAGLEACTHDVVARADADDICLPHRFSTQIPLMAGLDLLGSAIAEFDDDESRPGLVRAMPARAEEIRRVLPLRDPVNHPTVVFRASAVRAAGGYDDATAMEDYWLFARMIHAGARVANLPDVLVYYRVGAGAYERRGGTDMLRAEWNLQRAMFQAGFTTPLQALRNLVVRGGYRLVPAGVKRVAYRAAMRTGWRP